MKIFLAAMLLVATTAWAETTPNLITNQIGNGLNSTWSGIGGYSQLSGQQPTALWGCCTSYSGAAPFFDTSTGGTNGDSGQIHWSYGQAQVLQTIAINTALSGTGIQINGFNWSYDLRNMNGGGGQNGTDQLTAVGRLWNATGQSILLSESRTHNTQMEWTNFSSTVTAASPYALADVGFLQVAFTSQDSGFWAGYYGPQIRNVQASLNYGVDQCASNPLSSPDCAGYQQAYFTQQCTANPLYDTACPGYATAYHNQQCSINALYAATCPGYQQAYYNQQCSISALYDSGCPGYQQAYYDQQCSINPLYDSGCANYEIVSAATQPPATTTEPIIITQVTETIAAEPSATSTTSPTSVSPAAVVSVINPAPAPAAPAATTQSAKSDNAKAEAKAAEQKKTDQAVTRSIPRGATGAAAARAAAEKADEAAADSASATTIEAQQSAQNLVMGLMGFNPAFSAYQNAMVPDVNAAVMARQYNQPTVDNRSALRQLSGASDSLHRDMVDQQYGRMPQ